MSSSSPQISSMMLKVSDADRINSDLRESIWSGYVPCLFSMESNEIMMVGSGSSFGKEPISIFLLLPRISYLPLTTSKVHNHFICYAPALSDGMWFEYIDKTKKPNIKHALKWNYPIGVLYDLYHNSDDPLWKLTVHFQSYPSDDILMKCENINIVKQSFFNNLKESIFLSFNNISTISTLKKDDQNALWNGVKKAKYNLYFPIYQTIFGRNNIKNNKLIRYPFRLLLKGFNDKIDLIPISRPIKIDENHILTLQECLIEIIPGIMEMYYDQNEQKQHKYNISIKIQGMNIPLNTPMIWLIHHATYADCFLYIVIVKNQTK